MLRKSANAADPNDDGNIDISDAIAILTFLFLGGKFPAPTPPGPAAHDTTLDELGCRG